MINRKSILPIIYLLFHFSCKEAEKSIVNAPHQKPPDRSVSGNAATEAKITATLVSIEESRDSTDRTSACYKAPCFAKIKIESLERKGNLFRVPDSLVVDAFFVYTLYPTYEDLFPQMGKYYPGLKINDKFEAIIESRISFNDRTQYVIYDYWVRREAGSGLAAAVGRGSGFKIYCMGYEYF